MLWEELHVVHQLLSPKQHKLKWIIVHFDIFLYFTNANGECLFSSGT